LQDALAHREITRGAGATRVPEDNGITAEIGPSRRRVGFGRIVGIGTATVVEHRLHCDRHEPEEVLLIVLVVEGHDTGGEVLPDTRMHSTAEAEPPR
jgi:hypothetical protein